MFPVPEAEISDIIIDPTIDTYLANEERYIRKHLAEINQKSVNVYLKRYDDSSREKQFLEKICCDFKFLEQVAKNYSE